MSFKWIKSRKQFEKSNLTYCPETGRGYSYDWYCIVAKIDGKVVLNTYNYSKTTNRHIRDIENLLDHLQIKIDAKIEAPRGLLKHEAIQMHYESMINDQKAKIQAKGSRKIKNQEREKIINWLSLELSQYNEIYASALFDKVISTLLVEESA